MLIISTGFSSYGDVSVSRALEMAASLSGMFFGTTMPRDICNFQDKKTYSTDCV